MNISIPAPLADNIQWIGVLLVTGVGILLLIIGSARAAKLRAQNVNIFCDDFLNEWDDYRSQDQPGCYVITIWFRKPSKRMIYQQKRYDEVYVGQSINMYKRVFNHLTGHGNGDVYADVRNKRYVYVSFYPCTPKKLNKNEKKLIEQYRAIDSYNRTKGGAKLTIK